MAFKLLVLAFLLTIQSQFLLGRGQATDDVIGCGGFVVSAGVNINYEPIKIKLYTDRGIIKYISECAPNNGYYFIPLYDPGKYVLRVEPPVGWIFDPGQVEFDFDGKTDLCSRQVDINFQFKGFTIFGKVSGIGSGIGPKGVRVTLLAEGRMIKQNVTGEGGLFEFTEVLPGQYVIEASHERWKFAKNRTLVNVVNDNVNQRDAPESELLLWGYAATGKVVSDGRPIRNVQFALYGERKPPFQLSCDGREPRFVAELNGPTKEGYRFLCYTQSDQNGQFRFDPLPAGKYLVYSHHEAQNIRFEVIPYQYPFEIHNDDLDLGTAFEIDGFTVGGQVINGQNPADVIKNARIRVEDETGKSAPMEIVANGHDGKFTLNNIKTSTYVIKTEAEHYQFDDLRLLISPNSAPLPKITPSKYEVCGKIIFKNFETNHETIELSVMEKLNPNVMKEKLILDTVDNFCLFLPGNEYVFQLRAVNSADLKFVPATMELKVDRPRLDLIFEQMTVTLKGTIMFKSSFPETEPDFLTVTVSNEKTGYQKALNLPDLIRKSEREYSFRLDNLLPGQYTVTLGGKQANYFCWTDSGAAATVNVDEKTKDTVEVRFRQKGFLLRITLSHVSDLLVTGPDGTTAMISQDDRLVEHCAEEVGRYTIEPKGCHRFFPSGTQENRIIFDTKTMAGQIISLTALKHLVTSKIITTVNITDLQVAINVKSNDGANEEQMVSISEAKNAQNGNFEYQLLFYESPMSDIELEPRSSQLIFKPARFSFQLKDDCLPDVVTFYGRPGIFVHGRLSENIPDVTITVYDGETGQVMLVTQTDAQGRYQAGPFADEINLKIEAAKEGFVFRTSPEDKSNFEVSKLSSIASTVVDEDGQTPLNEVLVSLSGGKDNFRRNSFVDSDGRLSFENLHPGQYFIRFLRKEYEFEPSSKMIDLQNGDNLIIKVVGKKVAFSGFGLVDSLNSEPEPGIVVEAVGVRNLAEATGSGSAVQCTQLQEESVSESDGTFRILGLLPDCQYVIRIKTDCLREKNISKSIPVAHSVRVQDRDLTDLRFIVLYRSFQMDLTASLDIDDDYLSSITVELFRENEPTALYKQTLSSPFVFFPPILMDNRTYLLQVNANLDRKQYRYKPVTYTFRADRSHMHMALVFPIEQRSPYGAGMSEHEIGGTMNSIYSMILFMIGVAIYNHKVIQDFFQHRTLNMASLLPQPQQQQQQQGETMAVATGNGDSAGMESSSTLRKKIKPKKN